MLEFKIYEEINNLRNRVTEYREEEADYQLERRLVPPRRDTYREGVERL